MNKNRCIIAVLMSAPLVAFSVDCIYSTNKEKSIIKENIDKLIALENQDISLIEEEIKKNKDKLGKESFNSGSLNNGGLNKENTIKVNYKELYKNSVVMGDSQSEGLSIYNILNPTSVVAKMGSNIVDGKVNIAKLKNLNPQNIFILYGMNDVLIYKDDVERFIKDYSELILSIKEELPSTNIYINAILPVTEAVIEKRSVYSMIEEYNKNIEKMCEVLNVGFVDASYLLENDESLFEGDGMHLKPKFYPLWLEVMANQASLGKGE